MLFKCLSQLKCAALTKKTQGEYHGRTGMLFHVSGQLWKSGAEWYSVANNPALNETNSLDLLEGEVVGSLTRARTGRRQPQAASLRVALRAVLMLPSTLPCCWDTEGALACRGRGIPRWQEVAAQGLGVPDHPGIQHRFITERLPGSYWACPQTIEPRHYAPAAAAF